MFDYVNINVIEVVAPRICFCLYGKEPFYYLGAIHNAIVKKKIYPDWICRFYVQYPGDYCDMLIDLGCEIIHVTDNISIGMPHPQMWRFIAINDPLSPYLIFRDTDSLLNTKERAAVDDWIASGKAFHRMKEHEHKRCLPILGGMWGMKYGALPMLRQLVADFEHTENPNIATGTPGRPKGDMPFLYHRVWPIMQHDVKFHGINDRYGDAEPFPEHAPAECDFVGDYAYRNDWLTRQRIKRLGRRD